MASIELVTDLVPPTSPSSGLLTKETAWEVLERFGQALQLCDQASRQIRLLLEATQESLGADVVFWHPGTTSDPAESVGTTPLTEAWIKDFTAQLLSEAGEGASQVLRSFLAPGAKALTPWPISAALVRISSSRSNWMGALSFHPRRLFQGADLKVMLLARRMMLNHRQQAHTYEKLKDSLFGLVRCLTAAIDAKDPYTWGHSERVARMAVRLGQQMAMPVAFLSDLYLAGLLHDIGKIGIRDSVLLKADKLTDEEFDHIKEHPLIGDRLVSNVKTLQNLRPGVRNHHERFDGRGYPDRLAGEDIPMQARVLAVADACDAMMAARPYRPALSPQRIDTIMTEGAGTQWDPQIIEHFQACRHELYSICQRGIGESVAVAVERALRSSGSNDEFTSRRGGGERLRGS